MGWRCSLCLLVTILFVHCSKSEVDSLQMSNAERDALLDLYTSTNGNHWKNNSNWGFGSPCVSDWYGVNCVDGKVVFLYVKNN